MLALRATAGHASVSFIGSIGNACQDCGRVHAVSPRISRLHSNSRRFRSSGRGKESLVSGAAATRLESRLETLDKAVSVEWFCQIANGPGRKRLRAGILIGEAGEKNERNAATLSTHVILQLNAAHTGHLDISNYKREIIKVIRPQELFSRCKCMHNISKRPHETVGRDTYGFIIVNDCNEWKLGQIIFPWCGDGR